jgi:hypothetical protein
MKRLKLIAVLVLATTAIALAAGGYFGTRYEAWDANRNTTLVIEGETGDIHGNGAITMAGSGQFYDVVLTKSTATPTMTPTATGTSESTATPTQTPTATATPTATGTISLASLMNGQTFTEVPTSTGLTRGVWSGGVGYWQNSNVDAILYSFIIGNEIAGMKKSITSISQDIYIADNSQYISAIFIVESDTDGTSPVTLWTDTTDYTTTGWSTKVWSGTDGTPDISSGISASAAGRLVQIILYMENQSTEGMVKGSNQSYSGAWVTR